MASTGSKGRRPERMPSSMAFVPLGIQKPKERWKRSSIVFWAVNLLAYKSTTLTITYTESTVWPTTQCKCFRLVYQWLLSTAWSGTFSCASHKLPVLFSPYQVHMALNKLHHPVGTVQCSPLPTLARLLIFVGGDGVGRRSCGFCWSVHKVLHHDFFREPTNPSLDGAGQIKKKVDMLQQTF